MRGFSLVELMITIAIAAIMLTLAAPNMSRLLAGNRIATQASSLVSNLALARSEAIKRGVRTTICPSSAGTACTSTTWSEGYMVYADLDGDGSFNSGSDIILRVGSRPAGNAALASSDFSAATLLQFLPSGQASKAGSFSVCQSSQTKRIVAITLAGGISSTTGSNCP